MHVVVEAEDAPPQDARPVEVVERKGLGHPDRVCDAVAEALSLALSRRGLERHGAILHHNVDKALLVGGRSEPRFGGGRVREPLEIVLAGRAQVPEGHDLEALAGECVRDWLRANLRHLDAERHVRVRARIRPGSADLTELFERARGGRVPLANDTSCGVGHAPLSLLERLVLAVEGDLTAPATRDRHPVFGEDVKVMGVRQDDRIALTVACALVDRFVSGPDDVAAAKAALAARARERATALGAGELEVAVNAADDPARGSFYLTVTGTSAEAGDDGQAGRGNRVSGLIAPGRPTTMESVAGKNPISHVGKLYNLCANLGAEAVVRELAAVEEAECVLVSRIGAPIDAPPLAALRLRARGGVPEGDRHRAAEILRSEIARVPALWRELLDGRLALDRWPLRQPVVAGA